MRGLLLTLLACGPSRAEDSTGREIQDSPVGQEPGPCGLSVQPELLDFGLATLGAEPVGYLLLLANAGPGRCSLGELTMEPEGEFSVGAIGSIVVPIGGEMTMGVHFEPVDVGPSQATLQIWIDELDQAVAVLLTGEGTLPD